MSHLPTQSYPVMYVAIFVFLLQHVCMYTMRVHMPYSTVACAHAHAHTHAHAHAHIHAHAHAHASSSYWPVYNFFDSQSLHNIKILKKKSGKANDIRGVDRVSSLVKQNKKGKNYAVIASPDFFFKIFML